MLLWSCPTKLKSNTQKNQTVSKKREQRNKSTGIQKYPNPNKVLIQKYLPQTLLSDFSSQKDRGCSIRISGTNEVLISPCPKADSH
jgi:hypothetical protein